jgi:hypothetical protein
MNRPQTSVITVQRCVECRRQWLDDAERWRLKVLDEEPRETVLYCPDCHGREFET